jgi:hemoglobin-like flavoprotein
VNDHTIQLVKESYDLVEPIAPQAAAMFYQHLFEVDPSVRPLFRGDMVVQGERLMDMFSKVVGQLGEPEELIPRLRDLGQRHAGYGVRESHYDSARVALLLTLRDGLGVAYNEEVEEAWLAVYGEVASTMKDAARAQPGMNFSATPLLQ